LLLDVIFQSKKAKEPSPCFQYYNKTEIQLK
jgi:hypothetical protein